MTCSGCGVPIEPHTKYLCIYASTHGFTLAVGCDHFTPPAGWKRVFGGSNCFFKWIREFSESLRTCDHEPEIGEAKLARRKEKRFSIEEMEADRANAVHLICELFGFTDIRPGESMVSLGERIREWRTFKPRV